MNFPFETNGKLMILGVPILKHFRVSQNSLLQTQQTHSREVSKARGTSTGNQRPDDGTTKEACGRNKQTIRCRSKTQTGGETKKPHTIYEPPATTADLQMEVLEYCK